MSRMPLAVAGNGSRANVQNVDGELQEILQYGQITTNFSTNLCFRVENSLFGSEIPVKTNIGLNVKFI